MPKVNLPNGTTLNFPDGMSEADMSSAIGKQFPEFSPKPVKPSPSKPASQDMYDEMGNVIATERVSEPTAAEAAVAKYRPSVVPTLGSQKPFRPDDILNPEYRTSVERALVGKTPEQIAKVAGQNSAAGIAARGLPQRVGSNNVSPELKLRVQQEYNLASPEKRAQMEALDDSIGDVAREQAGYYQSLDEQGLRGSTVDTSREAAVDRLIKQGASANTANQIVRTGQSQELQFADGIKEVDPVTGALRKVVDTEKDLGLSAVNSVLQLGKSVADIGRMATGDGEVMNTISGKLGDAMSGIDQMKSGDAQLSAIKAQRMIESGNPMGLVQMLGTDPMYFVNQAVQSAASFLPSTMAASKATQFAKGLEAIKLLPPQKAAAVLEKVATGSAVGVNALMNAADAFDGAKGDYGSKMQAAGVAALASLAASGLTGGGLEGQIARQGIRPSAAKYGSIPEYGNRVLREGGQEFIEEGGGALGEQVAERRFDPNQILARGVVGAASGSIAAGAYNAPEVANRLRAEYTVASLLNSGSLPSADVLAARGIMQDRIGKIQGSGEVVPEASAQIRNQYGVQPVAPTEKSDPQQDQVRANSMNADAQRLDVRASELEAQGNALGAQQIREYAAKLRSDADALLNPAPAEPASTEPAPTEAAVTEPVAEPVSQRAINLNQQADRLETLAGNTDDPAKQQTYLSQAAQLREKAAAIVPQAPVAPAVQPTSEQPQAPAAQTAPAVTTEQPAVPTSQTTGVDPSTINARSDEVNDNLLADQLPKPVDLNAVNADLQPDVEEEQDYSDDFIESVESELAAATGQQFAEGDGVDPATLQNVRLGNASTAPVAPAVSDYQSRIDAFNAAAADPKNGLNSNEQIAALPPEEVAKIAPLAEAVKSVFGLSLVPYAGKTSNSFNGLAFGTKAGLIGSSFFVEAQTLDRNVGQTNRFLFTAMHEFDHKLGQADPDLRKIFRENLAAIAGRGFGAYADQYFKSRANELYDAAVAKGFKGDKQAFLTKALSDLKTSQAPEFVNERKQLMYTAKEEFAANFGASRWLDRDFINGLKQRNPQKFGKIVSEIVRFLDSTIKKLKGYLSGAADRQSQDDVDQFFATVQALEQAKELYAQYLEEVTPDQTEQGNGAAVFNKRQPAAKPAEKAKPKKDEPTKNQLRPIPASVADHILLEKTTQIAKGKSYATIKGLKTDLQSGLLAATKAAKVDLSYRGEEQLKFLIDVGIKDALYALKFNANAVGWYDAITKEALNIVSVLHPEVMQDSNARFAFTWALAVTSNGIKVDKNFELAEYAYSEYKRTGKMPTDIKAGNAQKAINEGLELFNTLTDKYGMELLSKAMLTDFKASQLETLFGKKVSGENADTDVRGAAILGAKIGNGFFSNLYGMFDALTMDRWLIRTWGRWTGTLIEDRPDMIKAKVNELRGAMSVLRSDKEGLAAFKAVVPNLQFGNIKQSALEIRKASMKPKNREVMNSVTGGEDVRKLGNALWKYMDGQKEAPENGNERNFIRQVFSGILTHLQANGYPQMTMADLQAILWYAERKIYEAAKEEDKDAASDSYEEEDKPDYAVAARKLVLSKGKTKQDIERVLNATRNSTGSTERDSGTAPAQGLQGGQATAAKLVGRERKNFLRTGSIHSLRSSRSGNAESSQPYKRDSGEVHGRHGLLNNQSIVSINKPAKVFKNFVEKFEGIAPTLYEINDAQQFSDFITASKSKAVFGASVYVYDTADYERMRTFVTADGQAGFAIKPDGDLVSVFSGGSQKGSIDAMLQLAIQEGAKKLDGFHTVLPEIYGAHGFKPVARVEFNEQYAPDGWDYNTFAEFTNGRPDNVFMVYDPNYYGVYVRDSLQPSADDDAAEIQSKALEQLQKAPNVLKNRRQPIADALSESGGAVTPDVQARYGKAKAGAAAPVKAFHFSNAPRKNLIPRFGTGIRGAEAQRVAQARDPRLKDRIYFYIDEGKGVFPESGLGSHLHGVMLENVYDISTDSLGIRAALIKSDNDERANEMERAIIDKGFDGYYDKGAFGDQGVAVLLGSRFIEPDYFGTDYKAPQRQAAQTPPQRLQKALLTREVAQAREMMGQLLAKAPSASLQYGNLTVMSDEKDAINSVLEGTGMPMFNKRQTQTPEFKAWADGLPLRESLPSDGYGHRGVFKVYHQTPKDFDEFIEGGTSDLQERSGKAIWLSPTPNANNANFRMRNMRNGDFVEGANVMPLYAKMYKPLVIRDDNELAYYSDIYGKGSLGFPFTLNDESIGAMKFAGYDGVINRLDLYKDDVPEIVVFDRTQVKSAIGNNGEFSASPSILKNRRQVDTPEFKRFFGNSAVVTPEGKPLMMYTGTSKDMDFDKFKIPKNGAWFTDSPKEASRYAEQNDSQGHKYNPDTRNYEAVHTASRVMPVYLRIENPYTPTAEEFDTLMKASNYKRAQSIIFERAKYKGHDGINMGNGIWVVIKDANQIKSAIGNNGDFSDKPSILKNRRQTSPLGFYSALSESIDNIKSNTLPVVGWKDAIKAQINKGNVKAEEVEWSGINDWLDLQTGRIKKEDVQTYLKNNGVQVEETTLGDNGYEKKLAEKLKKYGISPEIQWDGEMLFYDENAGVDRFLEELPEEVQEEISQFTRENPVEPSDTKYESYTLAGGENYREVLLTLPSKVKHNLDDLLKRVVTEVGVSEREAQEIIEYAKSGRMRPTAMGVPPSLAKDIEDAIKNKGAAQFRSNHWSQPNVLAHIRVNDRYVPRSDFDVNDVESRIRKALSISSASFIGNGAPALAVRKGAITEQEARWYSHAKGFKNVPTEAPDLKVLFIEELQSDWAQEGRKKGFKGEPDGWSVTTDGDEGFFNTKAEAEAAARQYGGVVRPLVSAEGQAEKLPTAPFVSNTDGWLNLSLKRIITMAASGGYDKVAFVNGQQSADRYDLSKQISKITVERKPNLRFSIKASDKSGMRVIDQDIITLARLDDYVGKEMAERIRDDFGNKVGDSHSYSGLDLKVGGTGMIKFYDQIVPAALKKLLPKVGGGRVETVALKLFDSLGQKQSPTDDNADYGIEYDGMESVTPDGQRFRSYSDAVAHVKKLQGNPASEQIGFSITPEMREKVESGLPLFNRRQTETVPFKEWFRNSTIVNPDGTPKIMYHGTGQDIRAFRAKQAGAIFVTADPKFANSFAIQSVDWMRDNQKSAMPPETLEKLTKKAKAIANKQKTYWEDELLTLVNDTLPSGENIIPLYVRAEKPFDYENADHMTKVLDAITKEEGKDMAEAVGASLRAGSWRVIELPWVQRVIKDLKFDGFYVQEGGVKNLAVYDPNQLKSAVGNDGSFSPSPEIHYNRRQVATNYVKQFGKKINQNYGGRKAFKGDKYELPQFTAIDSAARSFVDSMIRMKQVQDAVKKQGGKVDDSNDVYQGEELYYDRAAIRIEDFHRDELEPLVKQIAKDGLTLEAVAMYAYAQHASERNRKHGGAGISGSGMSDQDANKILNAVAASPKAAQMKAATEAFRKIILGTRKSLLDDGLITQELFNKLTGAFQNYVPLRGFAEYDDEGQKTAQRTGSGFSIKGNETIEAMGRRSAATKILENIVADRERAIIRGEKNKVGKKLLKFVIDNPDPSLWEVGVADKDLSPVIASSGAVVQVAFSSIADVMYEQGVVGVKVSGREYRIQLKDQAIARALLKFNTAQMDAFSSFMSSINRYLGTVYTSLNPEFVLTNAVRDIQTAMIQGQMFNVDATQLRRYWNQARSAASRYSAQKDGKTAEQQEWDKWFRQFRNAGGGTAFVGLQDLDKQTAKLQALFDAEGTSAKQKAKNAFFNGLEVIHSINYGVENALRVAAFRIAVEAGMSAPQAAQVAKNITVNFNRKGEMGQVMNAFYLFANASVQGTRAGAMALAHSKKARAIAVGLGASLMGLAMYGLAAAGDDDDGIPLWDKISPEVKTSNIVIAIPQSMKLSSSEEENGARYIKIPLPHFLFPVSALANGVVDYGLHVGSDGKYGQSAMSVAASVFKAFVSTYVPVGLIPTVPDMISNVINAKDRFGRSLVPEGAGDVPNSEKAFHKDQGSVWQSVARGMSRATGGDEREGGLIDLAPAVVRNIFETTTGGVGIFIRDMGSLAQYLTVGSDSLRDAAKEDSSRIPFLRRFYAETGGANTSQKFYEITRDAKAAKTFLDNKAKTELGYDSVKEAKKDGAFDSVRQEYVDKRMGRIKGYDKPDLDFLDELVKQAETTNKALKQLKTDELAVQNDDSLTAKQKRDELRKLDKERESLMKETIRFWNSQ